MAVVREQIGAVAALREVRSSRRCPRHDPARSFGAPCGGITGTTEPTKAGVAVVDVLTGLHATVGILAALRHREATGEGQVLEVTLLSSLQSSLGRPAGAFVGAGAVPTFLGNAHPSIAPYEVFMAADRPMVLAVGNDAQFGRLVQVLGMPDLAVDARFATNSARVAHRVELEALVDAALGDRSADEWQELVTAAGVPCGPINDIEQGFALATRLGLAPIVEVADHRRAMSQRQVANPVSYSRTPAAYRTAAPMVDEDRAAVLALLGMTDR